MKSGMTETMKKETTSSVSGHHQGMLEQHSEPDRSKGHKTRLERAGTQFRGISKRVTGT